MMKFIISHNAFKRIYTILVNQNTYNDVITLNDLIEKDSNIFLNCKGKDLYLRIEISAGGCSGFKYRCFFDNNELNENEYIFYRFEDTLFNSDNKLEYEFVANTIADIRKENNMNLLHISKPVAVIIDDVSMQYLKDAKLDFVETLGQSSFMIFNPNVDKECGCGISFSYNV